MGKAQKTKDGYKACCPSHDDEKASLSLKDGDNGKLLVKCFAGCSYKDIITKLEGLGLVSNNPIRYEYKDSNGTLLYTKIRYPNKKFIVEVADGRDIKEVVKVLYGLNSLPKDNTGVVFFVEGEKDVDTLVNLGLSAVSIFDGSGGELTDSYKEQLKDLQIVVIPDNDSPGKEFAQRVKNKYGATILPSTLLGRLVGKEDLPKGYDVTDAVEDGVSKDQLITIADSLLSQDVKGTSSSSPIVEDIVIATLVRNPYLISEASVLLLRDDFTYPINRLIYEQLLRQPLDWFSLRSSITPSLNLSTSYTDHIDHLEGLPVSSERFPEYYESLKNESIRRCLRGLAGDIHYSVDKEDSESLLQRIEKTITNLSMRGYDSEEDIAASVRSALKEIDERVSKKGELIGKSTTIPSLDTMTSGIQNKDLVVVAGRPGMGKTSFVTNLVENLVINEGERVLFFSLEMSKTQLITRMLSSLADIDSNKIRNGTLTNSELEVIQDMASKIAKSNLLIDDNGIMDVRHILSKSRRMCRKGRLGLIVVDYLQLVKSSVSSKNDTRDREVSHISSSLKALAKELDVPVIALSQLNRGVESRENKRPNSSDLRESGSIEQDADLILMLYRDVVYNRDTEDPEKAELIITKQRSGPVGTVYSRFNASRTRFEPYVEEVSSPTQTNSFSEVDMEDLI